jgi:hypothetical protein
MYEHFTDTENTGAPLVPAVEEPSTVEQSASLEHEEAILSHRIEP